MTQPLAQTLTASPRAAQVTVLPQQLAFVFGHLFSSFLRTASMPSRKKDPKQTHICVTIHFMLYLLVPPLQHFAQSCDRH